ncbi:MAG: photosystem reaction center subunit H [Sphingomonas sp. 28-66-16]|nr:MAG: photosystem reaction center subunit H [Sphingomonas sp. 28-66-16]
MIAAMMTAANLGARTTGWGFAVFTIGSVCWALIGATTGQTNLLATNGFLTLVNLVGIWRWLGRQARYQDGAESAASESEKCLGPSLTAASALCGFAVTDSNGEALGHCVEALIDRASGQIDYIVVASGNAVGLDEQLRGVARASCRFDNDAIALMMPRTAFVDLPILPDGEWPARLSTSSPPGN